MSETNTELSENISSSNGSTTAAVGAGGIGTLVVAIAQLLPDESAWKNALPLAAPGITIIVNGIWNWGVRTSKKYWTEKKAESIYQSLREECLNIINDPNSPPARKAEFEKRLKALEEYRFKKGAEILKIKF